MCPTRARQARATTPAARDSAGGKPKRGAVRSAAPAGVIGLACGLGVTIEYQSVVGPLAGWDAAALIYIAMTWHVVWRMDAAGTAAHAAVEDPTRDVVYATVLLAAVASLAAIALVISDSRSASGVLRGIEIGVSVGSVIVSWLLVHTLFTLRYARMYYRAPSSGARPVDFEERVRPAYSDFAYLAFTIGMTFQVSDTDLQTTQFRRVALGHALLSYLFGAVVLAAMINLVAGLAG